MSPIYMLTRLLPLPALLALLVLALPTVPANASGAAEAFGEPVPLGDLEPGQGSSGPFGLVSLGDRALFLAPEELSAGGFIVKARLWGTDGTAAGTEVLPPDANVGFPIEAISPDREVAFYSAVDRARGELEVSFWRTDGTVAGSAKLADGVSLFGFPHFAPDGRLYFAGREGEGESADVEPWVSDGTPGGTFRLLDTLPGPDPNSVSGFVDFAGEVYFRGLDPDSGRSVVWRTDGTTVGTGVAIAPEDDFRSFSDLVVAGSSLYLTGRDGLGFVAIWRSDGTAAGTVKLATLGQGEDVSGGGGGADFLADLSDGAAELTVWRLRLLQEPAVLWAVDGTTGGAEAIGELAPGPVGDAVLQDGVAWFVARTDATGLELFRTDGTRAGTGFAFDWCPGPCSGVDPAGPVPFAGRLLLAALAEAEAGSEPLVSDGTLEGTRVVRDLCPGGCGSAPRIHRGVDLGGLFAFVAADEPDRPRQLWVTDLTRPGTVRLTGFAGGVGLDPARAGDRLVVSADDGVSGFEPWALPFDRAQLDPIPPPGPWLTGPGLSGFEVKAVIRAGGGEIAPAVEPECIPETLCLSGAVPGRSELFVRVVGPKPNGFLWPTLVKFSTSEIEVWIRRASSDPADGPVRHYRLEGARPGFDELPGLFDRRGFEP